MAEFKDRLYDLMTIKKIKQADIVEKTGIAKSLLSMYLKGTRSPKQDKVFLIAKTYDVNIQWLMGYDYPMNGMPEFETVNLDNPETDAILSNNGNPKLKRLHLLCNDLTDEQIDTVTQYVEFLLSKKQ